MDFGLAGEYMVERDQELKRAVVYPAAARREMLSRELRALHPRAEHRSRRRMVIAWLGDRLIRAGQRLGGAAVLPADNGPFGPGGMTTATRT